jgi:hypothetical protein
MRGIKMTIKYVGPRAVISQHGVEFKDGKEDKFVYLMIAVQILVAIDKKYENKKFYQYDEDTKRFTNQEILDILHKYEPNIEEKIKKEIDTYIAHIKHEKEMVSLNSVISDTEKEIWIKNIDIMTQYRIQRAINKIYYIHCIKHIDKIIIREKIEKIITPFYEKFWHILQTLQGGIEIGNNSHHTSLDIFTKDDDKMMIEMIIFF